MLARAFLDESRCRRTEGARRMEPALCMLRERRLGRLFCLTGVPGEGAREGWQAEAAVSMKFWWASRTALRVVRSMVPFHMDPLLKGTATAVFTCRWWTWLRKLDSQAHHA